MSVAHEEDEYTLLGAGETKNDEEGHIHKRASYWEISFSFATLGWVAFGGLPAHIGFLQKAFVERRDWVSQEVFTELISLAQCLPGGTSNQVGFALGSLQRGVPGGLLSSTLFQHPGLLLMAGAGLAAGAMPNESPKLLDAFTSGLSAAGIGIVVDAAFTIAFNVGADRVIRLVGAFATVLAYYYKERFGWLLPCLIIGGGFVTAARKRIATRLLQRSMSSHASLQGGQMEEEERTEVTNRVGMGVSGAIAIFCAWLTVLVGGLVLRMYIPYWSAPWLYWLETFYRTGSLIFGGGPVVLPLLHGSLQSDESGPWLSDKEFFTGLGLVQSIPGPLFNFSAYLGALIAKHAGVNPFIGIAVCWVGLTGPGIILMMVALSLWSTFRQSRLYRDALAGFNAGAAGLVVAASISMYHKVRGLSPFPKASTVIIVSVFCAVRILKLPAPIAVLAGGCVGLLAGVTGAS